MNEITETSLITKKRGVNTEISSNQSQAKATPHIKPWVGIVVFLSILSILRSSRNQCKLVAANVGFQEVKEDVQNEAWPPVREAPHHVDRSWCPDARCLSSQICQPCQRRFLIIITNGRSASTTLTWMLDLLPGVRMGGENNNAIQKIMTMIKGITTPPFVLKPPPSAKYNAWYHNPIPDGSFACVAQKMIETIVPPRLINGTQLDPNEGEDIVGFKTIRLVRDINISDVPMIGAFLIASFPCARFLINYSSDYVRQAQSQLASFTSYKNKKDLDPVVEKISKEAQRLKRLAELLGKRAMLIDSAQWTEDIRELNKVVKWLGFDDTCAFPKLMALNTGRNSTNARALARVVVKKKGRSVIRPSPWEGKERRPREGMFNNNYQQKPPSWFAMKGRKSKPVGPPKAYQHLDTKVELDPRCRYVGRQNR